MGVEVGAVWHRRWRDLAEVDPVAGDELAHLAEVVAAGGDRERHISPRRSVPVLGDHLGLDPLGRDDRTAVLAGGAQRRDREPADHDPRHRVD